MPLDPDKLKDWPIPDAAQTYGADDVALYGLAVGYGSDPLDERQLRFVCGDEPRPAPTFPLVLGFPGSWMSDPATGIDWRGVLHGEQAMELHAPVPAAASILGLTRVTHVVDKGDKGAVLHVERTITDQADGALLATLRMAYFCRGVGGFSGGDAAPASMAAVPDAAPDVVLDLPTALNSALLYRLCGDRNVLHSDPAAARRAGFDRPILHGLCSLGVAVHAVVAACLGYDSERLRALSVRFSSPVYPGETLRTEAWHERPESIRFRVRSAERDVVVLDRGTVSLRPHEIAS